MRLLASEHEFKLGPLERRVSYDGAVTSPPVGDGWFFVETVVTTYGGGSNHHGGYGGNEFQVFPVGTTIQALWARPCSLTEQLAKAADEMEREIPYLRSRSLTQANRRQEKANMLRAGFDQPWEPKGF